MKLEIDEVNLRFIPNILCRAKFMFESLGSSDNVCAANRDRYREDAKIAKQARDMIYNSIHESNLAQLEGGSK